MKRKLSAITRWLEENQPDVFQRGLWDAINEEAKMNEKDIQEIMNIDLKNKAKMNKEIEEEIRQVLKSETHVTWDLYRIHTTALLSALEEKERKIKELEERFILNDGITLGFYKRLVHAESRIKELEKERG